MNKLVATAIVGTGQARTVDLSTGTAVDALTSQLSLEQPERILLVAAGSCGAYQQAGYTAQPLPIAQEPAPTEELAVCSECVAQIFLNIVQDKHLLLLPELLQSLHSAEQRLPYELLPIALKTGFENKNLRKALVPVLGARGRWLAQFSPSWQWVIDIAEGTATLSLDEQEQIWQNGKLEARAEVLSQVRKSHPDTAREWLMAVWKRENVDSRLLFLSTFEIQLSDQDEEFLERALTDRSEKVRVKALELLRALPSSSLNQRMLLRADALLDYADGKYRLTLPAKFDVSWQQDGIAQEKDPVGKHLPELISLLLSHVPPTHWEERFGVTPTQLLTSQPQDAKMADWHETVVEGWTIAALQYHASSWFEPLTRWWLTHSERDQELFSKLLQKLPQEQAESIVLSHLFQDNTWVEDVKALPQSWSSHFAREFLNVLKVKATVLAKNNDYTYYYSAPELFSKIALALPPDCFSLATSGWEFADDKDDKKKNNQWMVNYWNGQIAQLQTLLQIRQNIIKEFSR